MQLNFHKKYTVRDARMRRKSFRNRWIPKKTDIWNICCNNPFCFRLSPSPDCDSIMELTVRFSAGAPRSEQGGFYENTEKIYPLLCTL